MRPLLILWLALAGCSHIELPQTPDGRAWQKDCEEERATCRVGDCEAELEECLLRCPGAHRESSAGAFAALVLVGLGFVATVVVVLVVV